jgi:hypothetical protein
MGYYSDPTAARALGNINREFSRLEKKAKRLKMLYMEGKISEKALEKAGGSFSGLYRHVLSNVLESQEDE